MRPGNARGVPKRLRYAAFRRRPSGPSLPSIPACHHQANMNLPNAIERLRDVLRRQHIALSTEDSYVYWLRHYVTALKAMPESLSEWRPSKDTSYRPCTSRSKKRINPLGANCPNTDTYHRQWSTAPEGVQALSHL